jgi:hypothetical protein
MENGWRTLLDDGIPQRTPEDALVVYSDASLEGAGMVVVGGPHRSWRWPAPRSARLQQACEAEAAALALEAIEEVDISVLLVLDNAGVEAWLYSGNPTSARAVPLLTRIHRTLERRRQRLWVAHVESAAMIADGLSRGDQLFDRPVDANVIRDLRRRAVEIPWATATSAS